MSDVVSQRLNKYVALATGTSRRQADEWIEAGLITVNGSPAALGSRVEQSDTVELKGKPITHQPKLYIAFHKPIGYVCSRKKQGESDTIYTLLPKKYHDLKPVGRLDRDSSGLILLTNDGDFAHSMTHPSFHKIKIYEVALDKPLAPLHHQMIVDFGVTLEDGKSQFGIEKLHDDAKTWRITMSEGRNRQIRRTFFALGYTVTKLHRTQFGPYVLGDLAENSTTEVTKI